MLSVLPIVIPILAQITDTNIPTGTAQEVVPPAVGQHSIFEMIYNAGPVVQFVMLLLVVMSVTTWGIVMTKWLQLKRAKLQTSKFTEVFWNSKSLTQMNEYSQKLSASPVAAVFGAGHKELSQVLRLAQESQTENRDTLGDIENVERALRRAKTEELTRLEYGTTFLATTASAAPFIGLFGTVWGIMEAFMGLSQAKSTSIQAVAPGISEALIATAFGLAAAIPAAIFYNYFMQQVRVLARGMDTLSSEFLNLARRHFLR